MTRADLEWTPEDSRAASAEGWDLFICLGSAYGSPQIQRIDCPEEGGGPVWNDDTDVWYHVWPRGTALHIKALAIMRRDNLREWQAIRKWVTSH